jgi:hypothetical protein
MAVPDKVTEYLQGVRVDYTEAFDSLPTSGWSLDGVTAVDGVLKFVAGNKGASLERTRPLAEKSAVLLGFSFGDSTTVYFGMHNGTPGAASVKAFDPVYIRGRFLIYGNAPERLKGSGDLTLKKGTTYSLLLAILPGGGFRVVLWDPAEASQALVINQPAPTWSGLEWTFRIDVGPGSLTVDNYKEMEFDSAK